MGLKLREILRYQAIRLKKIFKKKKRKKNQSKKKTIKSEKASVPKANITDPESRIMKNARGYVQGYNAQIAVDGKDQIIIACSATNQENDVKQLGVMIDECKRQIGVYPDKTIADAGYWQPEIIKNYSEKTDLYVATAKVGSKSSVRKKSVIGRVVGNLKILARGKKWNVSF